MQDLHEPVEDTDTTNKMTSCGDCSFNSNAEACEAHACFREDFPEGHPMSQATRPIIWRKKVTG